MILDAASRAAAQLLSPPFRALFFKTLGLTLLGLAGLWFGLQQLLGRLVLSPLEGWLGGVGGGLDWLGPLAAIVVGILLAFGMAMLVAPVSAAVAGLFLDDIAEVVEREDYGSDAAGQAVPLGRSMLLSLKFLGTVIAGNLLALLLLLVPGLNIAAFFLVNGYLLGRQFFEFAAMRFRPEAEAKALRSRHAGRVFLGGLTIAAFMAVPLLNLLTPLFAATVMVHLHKAISAAEGRRRG